MVDSLTDEDLDRMEGIIDIDKIESRMDYEREFEKSFGIKPKLKDYLWDKRVWQKTLANFVGMKRRWTKREEQFILDNSKKKLKWIVRHFPTPRSYYSVASKKRRLKRKA